MDDTVENAVVLPPPSPLIFSPDISTTDMTNVVLIDRGFPQFQSYVNENSFAVVYEQDSSLADLKALLRQKFTSIQRIAFVSHYNAEPRFLEKESLFSPSDLVPGAVVFTKNVQGLIDIVKEFNVAHLDFLACKTLTDPNWTAFYSVLQSQANGVLVGASLDDTGNLKYGGNWVMENTNENVKSVYFNDSIDNYASLLADFWDGLFNYTYTVGAGTAQLQSVTSTISGAVTIPATVIYNSVTLTVNALYATFINNTGITSVVILAQITSTPVSIFEGCSNLTSVTFPDTVSSFGSSCLRYCYKLSYFNFPAAVTTIPAYFAGNALINFTLIIPVWITYIGVYAFFQTGITPKLYVHPGCFLDAAAFSGCYALTEATIYGYGSMDYQALSGCGALKTLIFGPGFIDVGNRCFINNNALTSLTLPSTLVKFDIGACFEANGNGCLNLKYVQIPPSVITCTFRAPYYPNFVLDFMHETTFPGFHNTPDELPSSTTIIVNESVQTTATYLQWVATFPQVKFVRRRSIDLNSYYHTFYTVKTTNQTVLTRTIYNNTGTLKETQDISFGGRNIVDVLQIFNQSNGTNPYSLGIVDSSLNKISMDLALCNVYTIGLTDIQKQTAITNANTYKEPHTAVTSTFLVTKTSEVFQISINGAASVPKPNLSFLVGKLYVFDQSQSTGTAILFYQDSARTIPYTTGVVTSGTPGNRNASTRIDMLLGSPATLYYGSSSTVGGTISVTVFVA